GVTGDMPYRCVRQISDQARITSVTPHLLHRIAHTTACRDLQASPPLAPHTTRSTISALPAALPLSGYALAPSARATDASDPALPAVCFLAIDGRVQATNGLCV